MSDMRALATAVEAYAVDNNQLSAGGVRGGSLDDGRTRRWRRTRSRTSRRPTSPRRRRSTAGASSSAYGSDAPGNNYAIGSGGRNKTFATPICGTTTNFNDDIYYSNGTFIQWPEGTQF